jgi:hypothetical protein
MDYGVSHAPGEKQRGLFTVRSSTSKFVQRSCAIALLAFSGCAKPSAPPSTPEAKPATTEGAEKVTALPPDSEYVLADKGGFLTVGGERKRYWAAIGRVFLQPRLDEKDSAEERQRKIAEARRGTDVIIQRLQDLGFNAVRLWSAVPNTEDYQVGDGSEADSVDYFISEVKKRGWKLWIASLNSVGSAKAEHASVISDPSTEEAWKQAVAEAGGEVSLRGSVARVWDPRLEALHIQRMKEVALHTNKYTGLKWSDDPVFGVWELTNEEWWMMKMLGGQWQRQPVFFRNQLVAKWNEWLKKKYGSAEKLEAAWKGLLPGESLEQASIIFAPIAGDSPAQGSINDANVHAQEALKGLKQKYNRDDFSRARGSDVLEFLLEIQVAHKRREGEALKTWGKSARLSPLVYDTGIGYEIQSQFMHQSADAVTHDAYVNGLGPKYKAPDLSKLRNETQRMLKTLDAERISANSGPWVNWLLKPPGIAQGVPWLEHNKVEGKPYLVYETQIQQPAKYRADFPLRLAALGAIQDWDFVCWHYFQAEYDAGTDPRPWDRPMDITTGGHPQGYHYTFDEVQNSMMRAAGHMFRAGLLKPAPSPTKFIFGRKSLYEPDSMDYGVSYGPKGMDMLQTVYQYGMRIQIDPTREDDEVIGPVVTFAQRNTHNPYTPTDEIKFDWKKGFLLMDAPSVASYTGLLARYGKQVEFKNGVVLSDVKIHNPPGIFEPMRDDEKFIAFALYSEDGQPLASTRKAGLSLVSTSFNSGFSLGKPNAKGEEGQIKAGTLPVLTARVEGKVQASGLEGMHYVLRDWHFQELGRGVVEGSSFHLPADKPVFFVEFERK